MAETTPTESESTFPKGLPIAATGWPTTTRLESPSGTGSSAWAAGIDLEHADVVEEVVADDARRHAVAVGELDVDGPGRRGTASALAGGRDHVGARQDRRRSGETTKPEPWPALASGAPGASK